MTLSSTSSIKLKTGEIFFTQDWMSNAPYMCKFSFLINVSSTWANLSVLWIISSSVSSYPSNPYCLVLITSSPGSLPSQWKISMLPLTSTLPAHGISSFSPWFLLFFRTKETCERGLNIHCASIFYTSSYRKTHFCNFATTVFKKNPSSTKHGSVFHLFPLCLCPLSSGLLTFKIPFWAGDVAQ